MVHLTYIENSVSWLPLEKVGGIVGYSHEYFNTVRF